MRKTLNINLGGLAFIIDENAYELLHNYLETLKQKFGNTAECTEIMNDIEARLAELLNQKLANRREVIGAEDVQLVMDALGKPEDIAGEETNQEPAAGASKTTAGPSATTPAADFTPVRKRLFRDPDDAKVGGVISGLCHYFGISDPTWMRIGAIVLIFATSGTIVLLYLLLLIVVPKASTATEKLQMKGEPVNISTIEKEIRDAASKATETVHRMVHDQNIFERFWEVILSLLKVFAKMFAALLIFVSMLVLVAVAGTFFAVYLLGTSSFSQAAHLLVSSPSTLTIFSFGFLLFFGVPFIGLIYAGLRVLLGGRSQGYWVRTTLFVLWFTGLVLLMTAGFQIGNNFRDETTVKHQTVLVQPARGHLFVQLSDSTGKKAEQDESDDNQYYFNTINNQLRLNGVDFNDIDLIPLGKPSLQLMPSDNDSFYVEEVISARGSNKSNAEVNAGMVIYPYRETDTVLHLRPHYYISKGAKYRLQNMKLRIAIPEGKKISFADNIDMWAATVKGDGQYDDTQFANTTWTVENGKVKCIAGENHNSGDVKKTADDRSQLKKDMKQMKKDLKQELKDNNDKKHKGKKDDDDDEDHDEKDKSDQDF